MQLNTCSEQIKLLLTDFETVKISFRDKFNRINHMFFRKGQDTNLKLTHAIDSFGNQKIYKLECN